jgi:threonine-phosphate decarboxylase
LKKEPANPAHGGDIYAASARLKIPERRIIDLSASINPLGVSKKIKAELRRHLKYLNNYPDPACVRLRRHLSRRIGVGAENILCGNGSTELIYLVVRVLKPRRALVPAPAFAEYERALKIHGAEVVRFRTYEADGFRLDADAFCRAMEGADMAFLCNPDSPTARALPRAAVAGIAEKAAAIGCTLVVDEAFMDFLPVDGVGRNIYESITPLAAVSPGLVVLRSMTKFYALSGLRLGYAAACTEILEKLKESKEPWTVNTLAQRAGVIAINDAVHAGETFKLLKTEKRFVEKKLKELGVEFYPSGINFYLLKSDRAGDIRDGFFKRGILVRDCSDYPGLDGRFLRMAVRTHRENAEVFKVLGKILS